jgi:hypothetical protein
MSHSTWRYGLAALIVAWLIDLLFWQTPPGVSLFIWAVCAVAAGFILARLDGVHSSPWSYPVAAAILVFSGVVGARTELFTRFLSFAMALGGLMLLAATFRSGNWVAYRTWDYVPAFFRLLGASLTRPAEVLKREPASGGMPTAGQLSWRKGWGGARRVLVGLLLSLPVLAVFGTLLSSADPVFSNQLSNFLSAFDISRLGEYIFRLFYILVLAFIFSGVYLHAVRPEHEEPRSDLAEGKFWLKPFLGWVEAGVVLALVDVMFAFFVGIQFWYFFGGQANISTAGFTYADYARRGFFELVAVAVISLLLYLGLATITRRETPFQKRGFAVLSVFLMAMVLVMLVSAFQRLQLYENAYGFTALRMYTHIFMIWLGLLMAAAVVFELLSRRQHFGLALLLTVVGFGLTFGFYNIENAIVHQNVARARTAQVIPTLSGSQSTALDTAYLASLSSDAVPALVDEFRRPDQPAPIHDALGANLACRAFVLQQNQSPTAWPSFNLADWRANDLLRQAQGEWSVYPVVMTDQGPVVRLAGGDHACFANSLPMD